MRVLVANASASLIERTKAFGPEAVFLSKVWLAPSSACRSQPCLAVGSTCVLLAQAALNCLSCCLV